MPSSIQWGTSLGFAAPPSPAPARPVLHNAASVASESSARARTSVPNRAGCWLLRALPVVSLRRRKKSSRQRAICRFKKNFPDELTAASADGKELQEKPPQQNCSWPLRGDQEAALQRIVELFKEGKSCVLAGRTGTGKTYVMANVYNEFRLPTVILAYSEELLLQIHGELEEHLPEEAAKGLVTCFTSPYFHDKVAKQWFIPCPRKHARRKETEDACGLQLPHVVVTTTAALYSKVDKQCLLETMNEMHGPDGWILMLDESHLMLPACDWQLPEGTHKSVRKAGWEDDVKPHRVLFVSATPREQEKALCHQNVVEMIIRPNGIINPEVIVNAIAYEDALQDVLHRLGNLRDEAQGIVFVNTIEQGRDLVDVLEKQGLRTGHLHHDMEKPQRSRILQTFRDGEYQVIVGTRLLKEGHSFPRVELVCVLAYVERGVPFSEIDFLQMAGRATRNRCKPHVVLYADKHTTLRRAEASKRKNDADKLLQMNAPH